MALVERLLRHAFIGTLHYILYSLAFLWQQLVVSHALQHIGQFLVYVPTTDNIDGAMTARHISGSMTVTGQAARQRAIEIVSASATRSTVTPVALTFVLCSGIAVTHPMAELVVQIIVAF